MGTDAPFACLPVKDAQLLLTISTSCLPRSANPPDDALRESFRHLDGARRRQPCGNLFRCRDTCRLVRLEGPMLTHDEFDRLCSIDRVGFKTARFCCTYSRSAAEGALEGALASLRRTRRRQWRREPIVLSDRAGEGEVPIPSLLSLAAVHNHLINVGLRTDADLLVETG